MPKTVKKIANNAFANAYGRIYKLRHVTIPGNIESIGYNAFAGSDIKTFTCKGKMGQMSPYAFASSSVETVSIRELSEIPDSAFEDCRSLKTIDCGTKVEKINPDAFYGCDSLTKVSSGNQIQSIGEGAFGYCLSLRPDAIPKTQQQQMEENLLAFRQLIGAAYKAYLRT